MDLAGIRSAKRALGCSVVLRCRLLRPFSDSLKAKFNREGHSPGPFDRHLRTVAPIYSVTGAMRTSGGFSAAYPALYLR